MSRQAAAPPASLTPRQQRFVNEYLVSLNATQAAISAGYSARTADVSGPRLLGNVGVRAAVAAAQAKRAQRTGITADRVLARLGEIALADPNPAPIAVQVAALRLLMMHLGLLVERHEHAGAAGAPLPGSVMIYLPSNGREAHDRIADRLERLAAGGARPPAPGGDAA